MPEVLDQKASIGSARLYFNCRIGHPLLTSCTDSYIGLTFAVGWGSRLAYSSSSVSTGWLPGTSLTTASLCQYRPRPLAPPCVQPSFRSIFSSSLKQELKQSALVAFYMLRPPFGIRSLMICAILKLCIGCFRNKLKTFLFSQIWCITLLELVVHLLSFHFIFKFHPLFAVCKHKCDIFH